MKRYLVYGFSVLLVAATGCAHRGASNATSSAKEPRHPSDSDAASAPAQTDRREVDEVVGVWTSGSCGERQYLRRIELKSDGRFVARDAVAPCPQGAQCAWSGIIDWVGVWRFEEGVIVLDVDSGQRLPDRVPDRFIVMEGETQRIAEQTGELVCPYQRAS